jgi:hypothetical protein
MKCVNLDKFKSRSFDGILLGDTSHDRFYRVYNFETNTVVESCDMTFDKTAPCQLISPAFQIHSLLPSLSLEILDTLFLI